MNEFDNNMIKLMQMTLERLDYELYLNDKEVRSDELALKEMKDLMKVYKEEKEEEMNRWKERIENSKCEG